MVLSYIFCDWNRNVSNIKGRLVLASFRVASLAKKNKFAFLLLLPHLIFHRITVEWFMGIEIPYKTIIGGGLTLYHGQALVINDGSVIGKNCTIRQCTTIGNKKNLDGSFSASPVIGDNVDIGSNVCIIGAVVIGSNVIIGAGSVIVKDIPANSIVVGNPGKVIKTI